MLDASGLLENKTKRLQDLLFKAKADDVILFSEILKLLDYHELTDQARSLIQKARNRLLRDHNYVFDSVRGTGIKRLSDAEIVRLGESGIRRLRRSSLKTTRKLAAVEYEKLSNDDKVTHNTYLSVIGAMTVLTQTNKIKAVQGAVREAQQQISIGSTLEIFK